jgi:hypothetical protein
MIRPAAVRLARWLVSANPVAQLAQGRYDGNVWALSGGARLYRLEVTA